MSSFDFHKTHFCGRICYIIIFFFPKFHWNLWKKFEVIAYISKWAFFECSQSCLCFSNMSKNIFAYKLFLSLNISDFNHFLSENCTRPREKSYSLFPSNLPLKIEVLSSPPFFENLVGGSSPPTTERRGAYYVYI